MSELVQQLNERLTQVTADRDALAKSLCYLIGKDWPDADGDTESEKAMSVVIDKQAAELSELRARVERVKAAIDGASPDHGYKHDGCLGCKLLAILNGPAPVFTAMGLDEPEFPTIKRGEE